MKISRPGGEEEREREEKREEKRTHLDARTTFWKENGEEEGCVRKEKTGEMVVLRPGAKVRDVGRSAEEGVMSGPL